MLPLRAASRLGRLGNLFPSRWSIYFQISCVFRSSALAKPDVACPSANVSVWDESDLIRLEKGPRGWMYFTLAFYLFRLALQGHLFTIGTELMKTVEEEVNFDGHFYTFGGFNVSIFASRLSCCSRFEPWLSVWSKLLILSLSLFFFFFFLFVSLGSFWPIFLPLDTAAWTVADLCIINLPPKTTLKVLKTYCGLI